VVIEARGIHKSFRIPEHRIDSLKERAAHPLTRLNYRELHALRDISFEVHKGEFFGIVGRNGSGKSSLLKILASIYRADAGTVRMAGRLAPFIELGVGFNPELTARENAILNGVLMGLSTRQARRGLDEVLEFAELEDFKELKLKNYSSGMMVRLAFAVMVQADADIMLVDEVLAVGDARFAEKCMDVFRERRRAGKTIVLVTHDMGTVQTLCDRAMVLHDGGQEYVGESEEAAVRYMRLNFAGQEVTEGGVRRAAVPDINARVVHAQLTDGAGEPTENVEHGEPIRLDVLLEARRDLSKPTFVFYVAAKDGVVVFGFSSELDNGQPETVVAGDRVRLAGSIENALVPGHYGVVCWVRREGFGGDMGVQPLPLLDFMVYGTAPRHGLVSVSADVRAEALPGPGS